jgi:hypothetical protein
MPGPIPPRRRHAITPVRNDEPPQTCHATDRHLGVPLEPVTAICVSSLATQTIERMPSAWADRADIGTLERGAKTVLVQADSALCPSGWLGILYLDCSVVVVVPAIEFKSLATADSPGYRSNMCRTSR